MKHLHSKTGSFILTITKVVGKEENQSETQKSEYLSRKKTLHIKRKSPKLSSGKIIYSFSSFDSFYDFCIFLSKSAYKNKLSTFTASCKLYEYNSNYYLILSGINLCSEVLDFISHTITEFSSFVQSPELFERKILEYGNLISIDSSLSDCIKHFICPKS